MQFEIMKASRIHSFGPPEVIALEAIARPEPGEGEVLLRVEAAGVGPWDAWVRAGKSVLEQPLPLTLGSDISGRVVALGAGVSGFQIGDLVYGVTNPRFTGAYAEYAAAHAAMLAAKPQRLGHIEAASVPVVAVTAWQMLFDHAQLRAGERVLILGIGGSVGAFAAQLALHAGARVAGCDVKRGVDLAASLGVSELVDIGAARFEQSIDPVDVVIDTVGGEAQERSFSILKKGGRLLSSVSAPDPERASEREARAKFILVNVTTAALERINQLFDQGKLQTFVGSVLTLAEAKIAHEMLDGLRPREPGKIVLSIAEGAS